MIIICVFTIKTILLIRKNIILASNTNNILNILILMFVLAWSPNVLIISNKIFINSTTTITTTPVVLELTNAVCIKTSMIWSSLFYLFTIQKLNKDRKKNGLISLENLNKKIKEHNELFLLSK